MNNRETLTAYIHEILEGHDFTTVLPEQKSLELKKTLDDLIPFSPVPDPMDNQHAAEGVWVCNYANFGVKHAAEQPMLHRSSLAKQSWNNLPNIPVDMIDIRQEILASTKAYNNVVKLRSTTSDCEAVVVLYGTYSGDDENRTRYSVAFSEVSLEPVAGDTESDLRRGFEIDADVPLRTTFNPPKLHSDIVYVDESLRINYGSLGGYYVNTKIDEPGYSIQHP
jgi:hypothetical protein